MPKSTSDYEITLNDSVNWDYGHTSFYVGEG